MRSILLGALLALPIANAAAADLALEAGQCRFDEKGAFQQTDLTTSNYMHPPCFSLSLADKWQGSDRWGWRVAFLGTGSIQARDNLALPDGIQHIRNGCHPPDEAGCYARFNGSGTTNGFAFAFTYEQPLWSHFSAIGETGLFFFEHHFKAEARLVDPEWGGGGRAISYNETSPIWAAPDPMLGLTLRYRAVYVAGRHYWSMGHRALSLTNHSFTQWTVGIVASF